MTTKTSLESHEWVELPGGWQLLRSAWADPDNHRLIPSLPPITSASDSTPCLRQAPWRSDTESVVCTRNNYYHTGRHTAGILINGRTYVVATWSDTGDALITDHAHQGPHDRYCTYDRTSSADEPVDLCSMPREAHKVRYQTVPR